MRERRAWRRARRAGFTLIELLIGTLVGAVVMAAMTEFFSFQLAGMRTERTHRSAEAAARSAMIFMVRQLEHVGRDPQRVLFSQPDNRALPPAIVSAGPSSIHYLTNLSLDSGDNDTLDPWEDVTFQLGQGIIWATQGTGAPVALTDPEADGSHVPTGGLAFTFFDASGNQVTRLDDATARASVRRITVVVTVVGGPLGIDTGPRVTLSEDVFLRNPS